MGFATEAGRARSGEQETGTAATWLPDSRQPRRREDLVVSHDADGFTVVHDPRSGRYFRLRAVEAFVLSRLDGARDLAAVRDETVAAFPGIALTEGGVARFAQRAAALGWLEGATAAPEPIRAPRDWLRWKVPFGTPERLLRALDPVVRRVYRTPVLAVVVPLLLSGAAWGAWHSGHRLAGPATGPLPAWAALWLAFAAVSLVHEFGHALTLRYVGGRSGPMGFMLLWGLPCFYTDVSGAWLLTKKRERILVGLAGLGWQFAAAALLLALLPLPHPGSVAGQLLVAALHLCGLTALLNLNPLLRLDGYWILCDWLGIPNLRAKAFGYLWSCVRGRAPRAGDPTRRERRIFLVYAVCAGIFSAWMVAAAAGWVRGWVARAWG